MSETVGVGDVYRVVNYTSGSGTAALVWSTTGAVRWNCVSATAALLLLWLPTFGPLKGIPYNPIQSVVHVGGVFIHLFAQEQVCGSG